jgi:hypothetical protein
LTGAGGMLLAGAQAVPQPNVPTQRYQITSWVAGSNEHGAYVLDTHTGQVRAIHRTHGAAESVDMRWER